MKKSFPEDNGTKKGVREFLEKKGFYVVLLLCVVVVAATAIFITARNAAYKQPDYEARDLTNEQDDGLLSDDAGQLNGAEPEDTQASVAANKPNIGDPASMTDTEGDNAAVIGDDAAKEAPKTEPKEEDLPQKNKEPKSKEKTPLKRQSFIMPVEGEITLEYAMDKLVYSKTLEDWRAHPGVDIASDRGMPVKAVADGVVCEVSNDLYYGVIVVIDHEDGIKSLYRNLAADDMVSVNQKIKQGEVIGSIGNTAMDESSEQPHLHFEVLKDDINNDPMEYLPQIAVE
ncbi:MAG: M23 family metallopeptidase [Clostridiaceae bacterium]|jgi:murein DD-endopeptidase MepM/ murein hydrolase activator NlpD|nr:M23 family metallopeptidase [Clostridiaceae bacterium]